ncbi:hypothetical protein [Paenibacillus sp. 1001270B_150601_E10]|uniref:hypothetical protein n=1 Tax=Paenibacillus sp. 1001270B_150601_E10 TaxID=2787079 RepID=UPI00189DB421|nr:hypothetical protein [Paenibacillus sp. 1001270B_150601_E10]
MYTGNDYNACKLLQYAVKVDRVSITETERRFESIQRYDLAELYKLSLARRTIHNLHG